MRNTKTESREEVAAILESHVVDRPVGAEGNRDAIRSPTHYVLRKNQGVSSLTRSKENLVEYIERALREARQHAKGLQI